MSGESAAPGSSTVMTIVTFIEENRRKQRFRGAPSLRGSLAGGRGRGLLGEVAVAKWGPGSGAAPGRAWCPQAPGTQGRGLV